MAKKIVIETCLECPHIGVIGDDTCGKAGKAIKNPRKIPNWCPLEEASTNNEF